MRYKKSATKRTPSGTRYKESTIVPNIPITQDDRYVEVSITDRLDLLAHTYYGNRNFWWIIAAANGIGKGTLYIQSGTILRLPANPIVIASNPTRN